MAYADKSGMGSVLERNRTTKTVVTAIASAMADKLGVSQEEYDFTLPGARQGAPDFAPDDVVVFGTPTYAGRVPMCCSNTLRRFRGTAQRLCRLSPLATARLMIR